MSKIRATSGYIDYSASRRCLPFQHCKGETSEWTVCQGLVAVQRNGYVVPLLMFGVIDDNTKYGYSIAVYWHNNNKTPWLHRVYNIRTLRNYAMSGDLQMIESGLTYDDMVARVHEKYPDMQVPSKVEFFEQFGLLVQDWWGV